MTTGRVRRIVHTDAPVTPSPSGLPTRHLVDAALGSTSLFLAEQWLQPGDTVLLHSHPCDEILVFLSGTGEARLHEADVSVHAGVTLFIPAGIRHGFRAIGATPLRVLVLFPARVFAETTFVEQVPDMVNPDQLA